MKILFAGSSDFSLPVLEYLIQTHKLSAVLTNPDSHAGRGLELHSTPVKEMALNHNIPIFQPEKLRGDILEDISKQEFDLLICSSYGKIFGPKFLSLFKKGRVNIHPSLLPRFRGATPIPSAILAKDTCTGVSLQDIVVEMDEGDIYIQSEYELPNDIYLEDLQKNLSRLSVKLLDTLLHNFDEIKISAKKQDDNQAVYCRKITKSMGWIQWWESAEHIYTIVRALSFPYSGVKVLYCGLILKIWKAVIVSEHDRLAKVGQVLGTDLEHGILLQCARGILGIIELQLAGKKRMSWKDFVVGNKDILSHNFVSS